jgi:hypothetical protein
MSQVVAWNYDANPIVIRSSAGSPFDRAARYSLRGLIDGQAVRTKGERLYTGVVRFDSDRHDVACRG